MTQYFTKDGDDFVEVTDPLHTQTDVDKIVKDRAERIARQQFSDYDDLKAKASKVDTISSEYETKLTDLTGKVDSLTKDLTGAKLETEKVKVVHEFKLSNELAEFVKADTAEEMRKQAEKLAKGIGGAKVTLDKKPKPEGKQTESKQLAGKLFGKSDD